MNTELNTESAIRFLVGQKKYDPPLPDFFNVKIDNAVTLLQRGEKFEKMWNDLKDLMDSTSVMDRLEVEYLGSITKKDLINNIIEEVYKLNIHPRADRVDVINMLIKLRDEEENV